MKWNLKIIIGFLVLIIFASCKNVETNQTNVSTKKTLPKGSILVADSIIYDVVIRDIDKEDSWESERLKFFKHNVFIDNIFDQLYGNRLFAFDFYTGEKLSTKDIKNIEKSEGFSRDKISKVQFNEHWVIDSLGVLRKELNSMVLGIESYSSQGTYTGHKALFRLIPNPNDR